MIQGERAITTTCHLIISSTGKVRVTKTKPALEWNEIAINLGISLPERLFKRPLLSANVIVGDEAVLPVEISPEILINTARLIEQQTGLKVELNVMDQLMEKMENTHKEAQP